MDREGAVAEGELPTVVVATRNRRDRLVGCLRALAALPEHPCVIVVDNGSTDGTGALVREEFPQVRLIELPVNWGAVARNVGVAAAGTPLVAFADDDSGWQPGALARAAPLFRDHPRLGLVCGRALVGADRREDPLSAFMASAPLGREPDLPGPGVLGFLAFAAVVRRDAFLATGGFDRAVFFLGEEERVAYDLARAGWGLVYHPDVQAWHEPGAPAEPAARERLAQRNAALTHWMRRPLSIAVVDTVRLLGAAVVDRHARAAARQLCARIPLALRLRGVPDRRLERHYRTLAAFERSRGRHDASPGVLRRSPSGRPVRAAVTEHGR
jgi:GT2 family glycosyltransferase